MHKMSSALNVDNYTQRQHAAESSTTLLYTSLHSPPGASKYRAEPPSEVRSGGMVTGQSDLQGRPMPKTLWTCHSSHFAVLLCCSDRPVPRARRFGRSHGRRLGTPGWGCLGPVPYLAGWNRPPGIASARTA